MAPDADTLRQRRGGRHEKSNKVAEEERQQDTATPTTLRTLNTLKSSEVCIDGIIYDLTDFPHPGGKQILLFGGNDVTVQYKMIHPFHYITTTTSSSNEGAVTTTTTTNPYLRKLKAVGRITDEDKIGTISNGYEFGTPFEIELKREVSRVVKRGHDGATLGWWFRATCYATAFAYMHYLWVVQGSSWPLAVCYGVIKALVGMNIQHDANHGSVITAHPSWTWINDMIGFFADLIGGNKFLWLEQHWMHHAFTNHHEHDPDAFAGEPLLLFRQFPTGQNKGSWIHQFQAWLFFPAVALYWFGQVLDINQVLELQHGGSKAAGFHMDSDYISRRRYAAVAIRCLYLYLNIVRPFQIHGLGWTPLGHIIVMGISGSLVLGTLFSVSHNFEAARRLETKSSSDANNNKAVCWYAAQVESSCNYGGLIASWFTGGLNYQIEHHLFPRMSSAWFPVIAPTVRRVCKKHGVQYIHYSSLWQNLLSTLRYLRQNGVSNTDYLVPSQ